MKRPRHPDPSRILEELSGEVLAAMDRGELTNFSDSLTMMMDLHALLLRSYTTVRGQGEMESYALRFVDSGFGIPIHIEWNRQYYRIFQRASNLLGDDPDFFKTAARVPYFLVDRTADAVPPEILNSLLELTLNLFHRSGDWWLQRAIEELGKRPSIFESVYLSGHEAGSYEKSMRDFVGMWERFQYFPEAIWNWETESLLPHEQWERLRMSAGFICKNLFCTAYMVAEAVWRGDEFSASIMSDSLIMWPKFLEHKFSDDYWMETALLDATLFGHVWEEVLAELRISKPEFDHKSKPEAVFRAILENMWVDVLLTLSAIMVAWGSKKSDRNSISSKISRKLLFAESEDGVWENRLVPGESATKIFIALIRQYTSGKNENSTYYEWLNEFVRRIDSLAEREMVPGRLYGLSTRSELRQLRLFQMKILMSQSDLDSLVELVPDIRKVISIICWIPNTDEPARRLKRELEGFMSLLDGADDFEWSEAFVKLNKADPGLEKHYFGSHKRSIKNILSMSLDFLNAERETRIVKLDVQKDKINELASDIHVSVFGQDALTFPLSEFSIAPSGQEKFDLAWRSASIMQGYDKASLTNPRLTSPVSGEKDAFSVIVSEYINQTLLEEVLSFDFVETVEVVNYMKYWESVNEESEKLIGQGLSPLLLIKDRTDPLWIDKWLWSPRSEADDLRPKDLVVSRDSLDLVQGYLATFNKTKVFVAPIPAGQSFVLPREIFSRLELNEFDNGCYIDINFREGRDPWKGDLVFSWAYRLRTQDYPILKLIYNNASVRS